jgi:hypothetical protein
MPNGRKVSQAGNQGRLSHRGFSEYVAELAACFCWFPACLYSSTLKMEAICLSETLVSELHSGATQKTVLFKGGAVYNS